MPLQKWQPYTVRYRKSGYRPICYFSTFCSKNKYYFYLVECDILLVYFMILVYY